jgi:hypothetical protein
VNREELLLWAAGYVDARGEIKVALEKGPTKNYYSLSLFVETEDEQVRNRLLLVNNNGWTLSDGWGISGHAAVLGFLRQVWKYLSPTTRSRFNERLRVFKQYKG